MAGFDSKLLAQGQAASAKTLQDRKALAESIAAQSAKIDSLESQIAGFNKAGDVKSAASLTAELDKVKAARAVQQKTAQTIDSTWASALKDFVAHLDPCDADPAFPLLLLPVRLETRYTGDGKTLRIRIFPDDVHVDQLDRGVSDAEAAAGRTYWTATWNKPGSDPALDVAWRALVDAVGSARAAWVSVALTPTNLGAAGAAAPVFPAVVPPLRHAAIARLLPDRFVAIALQGTDRSDAIGSPITPELVTGLFSDDGSDKVMVNGVPVPPGAEWIVDYDKAVAAGMAVNLPLKKAGAAIDQLFVCGVRSSFDAAQAEKELSNLFTAHRCGRGLAFLPQGTPSNNTETDRSAWTKRPQPSPPPRSAPAAGSNAAVLAGALGVAPTTFAGLTGADLIEQGNARAMGIALWPTTWGGLLRAVNRVDKNGSILSDQRKEDTRTFLRDNVRARGSLPSIRVGQQPYGVMPASSLSGWKATAGDAFEAAILSFLLRIRRAWLASSNQAAHIGSDEPIDAALRDILGQSPISLGLRVRSVLSNESYVLGNTVVTGMTAAKAITDADTMGAVIEQLVYEDLNLLSFTHPFGSLEQSTRPMGLPLVDDSDPAVIDALLAGGSPAIASVLQALLALALDQSQRAVDAAVPKVNLGNVTTLATNVPATVRAQVASVSGMGTAASSKTLNTLANQIVATTGEAGYSRLDEHQPARLFQTSLGDLAMTSNVAASKAILAGWALAAWVRESAKLAEVREAMTQLKTIPTDDRRILLCETLDLASHRLDSWLLGIVERRRGALRTAQSTGIAIGAYGWVEHIAPGKGLRPDGGYIHAPSIDQAATAGILRSAYLTHNPDTTGTGAFAIDLSSARVRTALNLMDGARQGQTLSALLGYQIERGLHESRIDRFAVTLRSLAPLVARRLTDRNDTPGTQAQESVAANNVVDGLRLLDLFRQNPASIRAALTAPPKDNPYIPAGKWPAVIDPEWNSFTRIMTAAGEAADAAAELLLAESVHQLVKGNMTGVSAALDAIASGDAAPPEADVVRTPAAGNPFTHRLLIASPVSFASGATGWHGSRPRAQAEPRLEQWAQSRLGDAGKIVVAAPAKGPQITADSAAICALDLIYDSGDPVQLDQRLRAAIPSMAADQALADRTDPAWPAGSIGLGDAVTYAASLRTLLVNAQPAAPADFARTNDKSNTTPTTSTGAMNLVNEKWDRAPSAAEVNSAAARAASARGVLAISRDALNLAIKNFDEANPATAVELRKQLEAIAAFGLTTPIADGEHLISVAQVAAAQATTRISQADAALTGPPDQTKIDAASQALFGDGFWILPALSPPPAADLLTAALGASPYCAPPPRAEIRRFIRDSASVLNGAARLSETLLLADSVGRPHSLLVAQLVEAGTPGGDTWIGGPIDLKQPTPRNMIANLVLDAPAGLDPSAPFIALAIHGWSDVIPFRERRGNQDSDPVDERRASGIAINAASAAARPPQAILLAISPDGQRWTTDAVLQTLSDTLALAKVRAVTLETTPGYGRVLPAIYEASYSLQGEKILDISQIANAQVLDGILQYLKGGA
jgi:hypothetical protein